MIAYIGKALVSCALMSVRATAIFGCCALLCSQLMQLTSSQIVVLPGRVGDGETPRVCVRFSCCAFIVHRSVPSFDEAVVQVFDIDNTLWVQGCDWKNPKGGPTVTVKACHDRGYAIAIDTAEKSDTLGWHKSKHLPFLGFTQEELNDHDLMRHQIKGIDQYTSKIEVSTPTASCCQMPRGHVQPASRMHNDAHVYTHARARPSNAEPPNRRDLR